MILALLIITAWMLILSLVLAVCLSARQGDRQQLKQAHPISERDEAPVIITAHPGRHAHPRDPAGLTTSATG